MTNRAQCHPNLGRATIQNFSRAPFTTRLKRKPNTNTQHKQNPAIVSPIIHLNHSPPTVRDEYGAGLTPRGARPAFVAFASRQLRVSPALGGATRTRALADSHLPRCVSAGRFRLCPGAPARRGLDPRSPPPDPVRQHARPISLDYLLNNRRRFSTRRRSRLSLKRSQMAPGKSTFRHKSVTHQRKVSGLRHARCDILA